MVQFGRKKSYRDYLFSKVSILLLLVVIALLGRSVFERFLVEREMADRRSQAEREREVLLQRKMELEERVQYMQGDRGIEEEIRKHFDVAREGEQVVILVGEDEEVNEVVREVEEEASPWYIFWR